MNKISAMFYFLALNSGSVFAGNDISVYPVTDIGFVFRVYNSSNAYRSMHGTSDNLFDSYLQEYMWKKQHKENIFGNHFITARKVSSAISSLNVCKKTFEKSRNTKPRSIPVTRYTDISLPEITGPEFNARKNIAKISKI